MIRVLFVDDHPIIRTGLRQTLSEAADIVVAGEAGSAAELKKLLPKTPCDVLLLDISLPDKSGLEILADVKREHPKLPVIILSNHSETKYAVHALKGGASGYLTKASAPDELVSAIRKTVAGRRYVSAELSERMADIFAGAAEVEPHETLSPREMEIFRMIVHGKMPQEIGETLHLSVKTVGTYRARLLEKMQMTTTAELVRYATEHDL